jgi:hypothetical protein
VFLLGTYVSEEGVDSIFRLKKIIELGTALAINKQTKSFHPDDGYDMFHRNFGSNTIHWYITEDGRPHSHHNENLKYYIALSG